MNNAMRWTHTEQRTTSNKLMVRSERPVRAFMNGERHFEDREASLEDVARALQVELPRLKAFVEGEQKMQKQQKGEW